MHLWFLLKQQRHIEITLLSCVPIKSLLALSVTGPPVNVSCNIFINSFGSIAETTMVCITYSTNKRLLKLMLNIRCLVELTLFTARK